MSQKEFLDSLIAVAEKVKKSKLTQIEIDLLVKSYNAQTGTVYERSVKAVTAILGKNPELLLERDASLDDINRLIADLKLQASNWAKSSKS